MKGGHEELTAEEGGEQPRASAAAIRNTRKTMVAETAECGGGMVEVGAKRRNL